MLDGNVQQFIKLVCREAVRFGDPWKGLKPELGECIPLLLVNVQWLPRISFVGIEKESIPPCI